MIQLAESAYIVAPIDGEYEFEEDIIAASLPTIAACKSGCQMWSVQNGAVIYKDQDGDWQ